MVTSDIARDAAIDRVGQTIGTGLDLGPDDVDATLSMLSLDKRVTVYSMLNGEPKSVRQVDLRRVLQKTLPDGRPAHWAEGMPGEAPEYVRGQIMCMLHPDFDESDGPAKFARDYVDHIGLTGRTCNMMAPDKNNIDNFKSVYDRDDHMAKKHPREWRTIEAALEKAREELELNERRADREATQRQGDALMALAAGSPATTQPEPAKEVIQLICDVEDCDFESPTDIGLARHKRMARDEAHQLARGEEL